MNTTPNMANGYLREVEVHQIVALLQDQPQLFLLRGQVGTVVARSQSGICDVEFYDLEGAPYAKVAIADDGLLPLYFEPVV